MKMKELEAIIHKVSPPIPMILLTDEEITERVRPYCDRNGRTFNPYLRGALDIVAKAQLKKVVENGGKPIYGEVDGLGNCATITVHIPLTEYRALLEEVKE